MRVDALSEGEFFELHSKFLAEPSIYRLHLNFLT